MNAHLVGFWIDSQEGIDHPQATCILEGADVTLSACYFIAFHLVVKHFYTFCLDIEWVRIFYVRRTSYFI